jgi:hypothetical protein
MPAAPTAEATPAVGFVHAYLVGVLAGSAAVDRGSTLQRAPVNAPAGPRSVTRVAIPPSSDPREPEAGATTGCWIAVSARRAGHAR